MNKSHKIFFAIPFDKATQKQYNDIRDQIQLRYKDENVTCVIGNKEVGPSPSYSEIATYKAQNRDLHDQFTYQITDADVIVADLTHNNPNVHLELGIALTQNKNILRVSGRSLTELGFDIRNLEMYAYKDAEDLLNKITGYLDTFFKIKRLQMSKESGKLYCEESVLPIKLRGREEKQCRLHSESNCQNLVIRDGAVKVEFDLLDSRRPDDWFGIFFRAGESPFLGSHLVYVRKDGRVEIAVYPGSGSGRIPGILARSEKMYEQNVHGKHSLQIEFENNQAEVTFEDVRLVTDKLRHQTAGQVVLAAYCTDVDVHSAQMICRDTIEWATK